MGNNYTKIKMKNCDICNILFTSDEDYYIMLFVMGNIIRKNFCSEECYAEGKKLFNYCVL